MLRLLEVFAYGTYGEYLQRRESDPTSLPELTPQMAKKLRLLTLASLAASSSRRLGYARLQSELGVDTVRELEDLVVEAANADVVRGKLDQRTLQLEVVYAMPRDIRRVSRALVVHNVRVSILMFLLLCPGRRQGCDPDAGGLVRQLRRDAPVPGGAGHQGKCGQGGRDRAQETDRTKGQEIFWRMANRKNRAYSPVETNSNYFNRLVFPHTKTTPKCDNVSRCRSAPSAAS